MIRSGRELLVVSLLFALLTLVFARPLPSRMTREIPVSGDEAQSIAMLYGVAWGVHALSENPFRYYDAPFFHPHESALALLDQTFGLAAIAAPVNWSTGNMFLGYNAVWLLTFFLSGIGAYLLTRQLTDSGPAAFLAGILFAFHPFRFQNAGSLNALAMMWLPFALLSLHLWVVTRQKRQLFLFAAFSLFQFVSSGYGAVFLLLATLLYALVLLAARRGPTMRLLTAQRWLILLVGALTLAAAAPFMAPYLEYARRGIGIESTLDEARQWSVAPADLLHRFRPAWTALILAVVAIGFRGGRSRYRAETVFYAVLCGAALVLSLGPGSGIPLPFALFHRIFPGGSFIHVPARFLMPAALALAVLAGVGLGLVLDRVRARAGRMAPAALGGLACLLVLVEIRPAPVALARPLPRGIPAIYTWLGNTGGEVTIIELPMAPADGPPRVEHARYQLYSLVHHNRLVNGVAGFVPPATARIRRAMETFPDRESVALLRSLGVTYVLVHSDLYPPDDFSRLTAAVETSTDLGVVERADSIWVLEVIPEGPPAR